MFGEKRSRAVILDVAGSCISLLCGSSKIHSQWNSSNAQRDRLVFHHKPPCLIVCFSSYRMSWLSPTGSLFIFLSGLLLSLIYLSSGTLPVDVCAFCVLYSAASLFGSLVGPSWSLHASILICLRSQIWSLRLISKHEVHVCVCVVCVWPACPLLHLSPQLYFPPVFPCMWSCPAQDEWPAVTRSVFLQGWIHLPHVSPKGHTINRKQSLAERYLEDGQRAQQVLLGIHLRHCWV